jgi:hypothetical protein
LTGTGATRERLHPIIQRFIGKERSVITISTDKNRTQLGERSGKNTTDSVSTSDDLSTEFDGKSQTSA